MPSRVASLLFSRAALIGAGLAVFLGAVLGLCGPNSLTCIAVLTSDGAVALAWIAGAAALGAVILRPLSEGVNRSFFVASAAGLGFGIFSLLALGLGLAGWLNRPVAIAFPVVSGIVFLVDLILRHRHPLDRSAMEMWLTEPAGSAWLWLVPVVSLAVACVSASIMPGILWKPLDPHPYDVTSYHLLVPREWYEGGRIVPLDHNVFSYFPFNVEMQFLLLMHAMGGPWAGMYACQFLNAGVAGVMVVGVYGASRKSKDERRTSNVEHRTSKSEERLSLRSPKFDVRCSMFVFSSIIGGTFAAIIPWTIMLAGTAYVESALMLYTALSIGWAVQAIGRPDRLGRYLILSGIMAGLACGVKITAVPMLLLAVPAGVGIALLSRAGVTRKKILLGCGGLLVAGLIVLLPWLVRNFAWSGNPLFPVGMSVLGKDRFTDEQVERFRVAHSPTESERSIDAKLKIVWNEVLGYWQYGYVLLPLAIVGLALRWRDRETWLLLICGLFVFVVWIGFTHLLPRFLVMLIPIGGIAVGRIQWGRAWPVALALLLSGAGLGLSPVIRELDVQSNPPNFNGQPRPAIMGMEDLPFMLSPELVDARDRHQQIALIGDAQAFLYQIPMSQMHYRTVFNVQGSDPISAWTGRADVKGNPGWLLVINPMEIERLHETYVGMPALPPAWAEHGPEPFYLRGDQVPASRH